MYFCWSSLNLPKWKRTENLSILTNATFETWIGDVSFIKVLSFISNPFVHWIYHRYVWHVHLMDIGYLVCGLINLVMYRLFSVCRVIFVRRLINFNFLIFQKQSEINKIIQIIFTLKLIISNHMYWNITV